MTISFSSSLFYECAWALIFKVFFVILCMQLFFSMSVVRFSIFKFVFVINFCMRFLLEWFFCCIHFWICRFNFFLFYEKGIWQNVGSWPTSGTIIFKSVRIQTIYRVHMSISQSSGLTRCRSNPVAVVMDGFLLCGRQWWWL